MPNKNLFAAFANLLVFPMMGLMTVSWSQTKDRKSGKHLFLTLILLLMMLTLIASASEGGVLTFVLVLAFFLIWQQKKKLSRLLIILCLLGFCSFFIVMKKDHQDVLRRLEFYGSTTGIVLSYPLMGTGLGTFSLAAPMYQPPASGEILDKMHNDYLELIVTSGVSSVFLFLMAAGLFKAGLRSLKEVRLKTFTFLGVLTVAVHGMADFPFQNISITWLAALWLGLSFVKEKHMIPVPVYVKILLLLLGIIMLPSQIMRSASALTGGNLFPAFSPRLITENLYESRTSKKCSEWIDMAERVAGKHPRYAPLRAEIARCYESMNDYDRALEYMEEAVKQEPYNIQMRLSAAKLCYMQGKWDDAAEHLISARSVGMELKFMIPLEPQVRDSVLIEGNRRYVDLYPYRGVLSYRSAIVQLRKWKSNLAWPMIKEGLARYPSSVELLKQAMDYLSGTRPDRSFQFAKISYSMQPESTVAFKAAHLARDAARYTDAETWFLKSLDNPDDASRYAIQTPKFVLDRSQALQIMISQYNRDPHPFLAFYIGINYDNHGEILEASRWYEQAIRMKSDHAPFYKFYYDMMVRQGDATAAADVLRRAKNNLNSKSYRDKFLQ